MTAGNQKSRITRRGFLERSVGAAATAGMLAGIPLVAAAYESREQEQAESGSSPISGKIALEEHFAIPETLGASFAASGPPEFQKQIQEIGSLRIAEMDRGGVGLCILSLTAPGIQGIPRVPEAVSGAESE